jgi:hypothetical protein
MSNAVDLRISAANSDTLCIAGQDTADFDSEIHRLLPSDAAPLVLGFKPFVFILSNRSTRALVAYDIRFVLTRYNGKQEQIYSRFADPTAILVGTEVVTEAQDVLLPARHRVISLGMIFNQNPPMTEVDAILSYKDYIRNMSLEQVRTLDVALEAAVRDDGLLIGTDTGNLASYFSAAVEFERSVYKEIATALEAGTSVDTTLDKLRIRARQRVMDRSRIHPHYELDGVGNVLSVRRRSDEATFVRLCKAVSGAAPLTLRARDRQSEK